MREPREDLTLAPEPGEDLVGVHAALDELERDALLELAVDAFGQEHLAHSAATEETQRAIGADALADGDLGLLVPGVGRGAVPEGAEALGRGLFEEALRLRVGLEKQANGDGELRIRAIERFEAGAPLLFGEIDDVGEDVARLAEAIGRRHSGSPGPPSSR